MDEHEIISISNVFGVVTDKRVIVYNRKGVEDIPVKKIISITLEQKKNKLFGVMSAIAGVFLLTIIMFFSNIPGYVVAIWVLLISVCLLGGIIFLVGDFQIKILLEGKGKKIINVRFARFKEGSEYANAIRKQIVRNHAERDLFLADDIAETKQ